MLAVIDHIELAGKFVESEPLPTEGYTDPDDIMFAEVLITSNADTLITGNVRHYKPLLKQNTSVLTPAQFMEKFFPKQA
jgi:predicted nucleic acid-binding protein